MTTYTANIGADHAAQFTAPLTDLAANGYTVEDLGDGRIRLAAAALGYLRHNRSTDDDGLITGDVDEGMTMWIGGDAYPVEPEAV